MMYRIELHLSKMQSVAVTGASGHIGNVLCRKLQNIGTIPRVLVHHTHQSLEGLRLQTIQGDLCSAESLDLLLDGVDTVFHLAAHISLDPRKEKEVFRINLEGTSHLIRAALRCGVKHVVHFSTIHVLDPIPTNEVLDETRAYNEHSQLAYEKSKLEAEKLILEQTGFQTTVLIPTGVIGPFDFGPSILGRSLKQLQHSLLPFVLPYGFNWVDVRDLAQAAIQATELTTSGSRFILGGEWKTLPELARMVRKDRRFLKSGILVPPSWAYAFAPLASWFQSESGFSKSALDILKYAPENISSAKAKLALNFNPRSTEMSIADAMSWHQGKFTNHEHTTLSYT